jgi:hypothetical protein
MHVTLHAPNPCAANATALVCSACNRALPCDTASLPCSASSAAARPLPLRAAHRCHTLSADSDRIRYSSQTVRSAVIWYRSASATTSSTKSLRSRIGCAYMKLWRSPRATPAAAGGGNALHHGQERVRVDLLREEDRLLEQVRAATQHGRQRL